MSVKDTKVYIFSLLQACPTRDAVAGRGYVSESAIPYRRIGGEFSFFLN